MRRARIKAVANLSAARRPAAKSSAESESTGEKPCDSENSSISQGNTADSSLDPTQAVPIAAVESKNHSPYDEIAQQQNDVGSQPLPERTTTFKTPLQLPRNDCELSVPTNADKFKRFKIAPRLKTSRQSVPKAHNSATPCVAFAETCEDDGKLGKIEEKLQDPQFTVPTKLHIESPRDVFDTQMQYPSAPPSPFPYAFGHNRIRTDSLCSMKSNRDITVANLQPRKNVRTEDQKIQDQKKESRERLSNKDLDKSQLRMFDMIYFNPLGNPMKQRSPNKSNDKLKKPEPTQDLQAVAVAEPAAVAVPQLRLNANGEMVLDETSLVIESEQQKQNRNALATSNVVYDDDLSGNYGYYKRQQRTKEWPHEETVKFYRCLNTVGTDFSLMLNLFPNRTRRDLKLKFKKEEKNNPQLIDKALLKHNTFDLDNLKKDLDTEEEARRKAADLKSEVKKLVKLKILKKQEAKLKAKTKIEKVLSEGATVINIVDHMCPQEVKENLNVPKSLASGSVGMNQPKKLKVEDGATSVMTIYATVPPQKPVKRPRQSKTSSLGEEGTSMQPCVKKQRKKNPAVVIEQAVAAKDFKEEVSIISHAIVHKSELALKDSPINVPVTGLPSSDHTVVRELEKNCETELHEASPTVDFSPSIDKTSDMVKVQDVTSIAETQISSAAFPIQNAAEIQSPSSDITETATNPSQSTMIVANTSVPEKKPKTRRGKHKPTLVTRLKLDANGEMVMDEPAITPNSGSSSITPSSPTKDTNSTIQMPTEEEPAEQLPALQTAQITEQEASVDENLNETYAFDDESAFLNNLDLEKLVLVQAQRDGVDVFEIHEINPVTQEISEIPLDLPARYFDLIISVMTSQDEEE